MSNRSHAVRATLLVLLAMVAGAWVSPAPDVVVDCETSLAPALSRLADAWSARSHVAVHIFVGPDGRLMGLIRHRARADVVVADRPVIDALRGEGLLAPNDAVTLGDDPYVLVAAEGAAAVGAAAAVARYPAVVTDPTSAASFDGQGLLRRIAGDAKLPAPPRGVATTQAVIDAVARGPGLIGLTRRSDVTGKAGLSIAAAVPVELARPARIEGALTKNGQSGRGAEFLAFIAGPGARPLWMRGGLEMAQ